MDWVDRVKHFNLYLSTYCPWRSVPNFFTARVNPLNFLIGSVNVCFMVCNIIPLCAALCSLTRL
jgi:hypothetical protein